MRGTFLTPQGRYHKQHPEQACVQEHNLVIFKEAEFMLLQRICLFHVHGSFLVDHEIHFVQPIVTCYKLELTMRANRLQLMNKCNRVPVP